jgi:ribosomal protein S18 acetylase RimI-like enzyme
MIEIRSMASDQWRLYKDLRCAALAEATYAFSSTLKDALKRSDEEWRRIARQYASDPKGVTFFAFEADMPCGMSACVINGSEAEMFAVWVDPAFRRRGAGRALIDYACTWSRSRGAELLKVGVFDDNPGALAFYRSAGFSEGGETKPELSTENRTVLLLSMNLHVNAGIEGQQ